MLGDSETTHTQSKIGARDFLSSFPSTLETMQTLSKWKVMNVFSLENV